MAAGLFGFFTTPKIDNGIEFYPGFKGIGHSYTCQKGSLGRKVIDKLHQDRFFETRKNITIGFEGINLSKEILNTDAFFKAYQQYGIAFVKKLKGSYAGFVLDEETNKLYLFNDNLATRSIYYYHDKHNGFAFASNLQILTKAFRQHNIDYSLNKDAVYMMALYGFILDNQTYVKEIKSLPYSSILSYDLASKELNIDQYFEYTHQKNDISYNDAINKIEELLVGSIDTIWQKNKLYSDKYFSLLSGGMDARVNALIAKELGYDKITSLTFGQSESKDVIYAQQIAEGEKFNHFVRYLDGGQYLLDNIFENYIIPNDGMVFFNASAHLSSTLSFFDFTSFPIVHSGQIGDVLFGAFVKDDFDFFKNKENIGYTGFVNQKQLLKKIESLDSILERYQQSGYELYSYEQRQIHATIMGDRSINHMVDTISPFYDKELIRFCMALPNTYKKNQKIYFDWLKKYHPQILNYPWDKINMKPTNRFKIKYAKLFKKYANGARKYFNWNYESMNPYGTWVKQNKSIIRTLDKIVETETNKPYIDLEIAEDLKAIYKDNIFEFRNKFAVVTALYAIKLHFKL